jgi:hypothetical protein
MEHHVAGKAITMSDVRKNPFQTIQLAEHGVQSGTSVLNAVTEMKKQNPNLDVTETVEAAVKTIKGSLELTSLVIGALAEGMDIPAAISHAVQTNGVAPHGDEAVPGEPTYVAPSAEA